MHFFYCQDDVGINWKPTWIHTDIMDDNIHMEPFSGHSCFNGNGTNVVSISDGDDKDEHGSLWRPNHILDFSDLSVGQSLISL